MLLLLWCVGWLVGVLVGWLVCWLVGCWLVVFVGLLCWCVLVLLVLCVCVCVLRVVVVAATVVVVCADCARMTPIPFLTRREPWMITLLTQGPQLSR